MISVYINYPVPHFSIRKDVYAETRIRKPRDYVRIMRIDESNKDLLLLELGADSFRFTAKAGLNDLWLEIDLGGYAAEVAFLKVIQETLGARYRPIKTAEWRE